MSTLAEALRDRYQLERELGQGGMATVYLARDLKHDRPVALKLLRPELGAILGAERFLREIRLTAALQHPNILPLLDSGEAAGQCFYVMPYVDGESLRQRLLREGQLPLEEALRLASEIADALDCAHQQGIIHRDIKPENILLTRGHALVADFGIALAVTEAGGGRLTETGLSLGTPAYMSPEQALAEPRLDGRSDQYSLACVLYEMLAGEPPYTGPSAQAIIAKRLSEPVPHLSTLRQVPDSVEAAVTRSLAKAPADRFTSMGDFRRALVEKPVAPIRAAIPSRLNLRWMLAGGVMLAVTAGLLLRQGRQPPRVTATATQRQFTFSAQVHEVALAPDGRALAYVKDRQSLVIEPLSGSGPIELAHADGWVAYPRWSPDGGWIYFNLLEQVNGAAAIYRVPAHGGTPTRLISALGEVDLSPDGRELVRGAGKDLIFHDAATGAELRRIPVGNVDVEFEDITWPIEVAWSPDGRWIAVATQFFYGGEIAAISVDGRRRQTLAPKGTGPVRWGAGSNGVYYMAQVRGGSEIRRVPFNAQTGRVTGPEVAVLGGLPANRTGELLYDVSRSGSTLAYVGGSETQHLWSFRLDPGRDTAIGRKLSVDSRAYDWPAINQDGSLLAVMQHDEDLWNQGNYYTVALTGGPFARLTQGDGYKSNPSWAPDGRRFLYTLTDSTGSRLVLTDGSGQRRVIGSKPPAPLGYFRTAWSADGRKVLYPTRAGKALVVLEPGSGAERIVSEVDSGVHFGAVLSPDAGEVMMAVLRNPQSRYEIRHATGNNPVSTPVPSPGGDNIPLVWRSDGWIYLFNDPDADNRAGRATSDPAIWRMRSDGSRQQLVAHLPAQCRFGFASMSADGHWVACAVLDRSPDAWLVSNFDQSVR